MMKSTLKINTSLVLLVKEMTYSQGDKGLLYGPDPSLGKSGETRNSSIPPAVRLAPELFSFAV